MRRESEAQFALAPGKTMRILIILGILLHPLYADGVTGGTTATLLPITPGNLDVRPVIATAPQGQSILSYVAYTATGTTLNVVFYNASGAIISGPAAVPGTPANLGSVSVAASRHGYMLVYDGAQTGGANRNIFYIIYSLAGAQLASGQANVLTSFDNTRPRCVANNQGDFAIAWIQRSFPNSTGVMVRRFNVSGAAIDPGEVRADNPAQSFSRMDACDVGYWPSGKLIVVWHDGEFNAAPSASNSPDGFGQAILGRWFDSNLQPLTANVVMNNTTANDQFEPLVRTDERNRCIVGWCGDFTANLVDAWCRAFDDAGNALDAQDLNLTPTNTASDQLLMGVAGTSSGEWVLTWMDAVSSVGQPAPRVSYARLSQQRTVIQSAFIQPGGLSTEGQFFPRVGSDEYGNFIVAYQFQEGTSLGSTSAAGLQTRRYKRNMISMSTTQPTLGAGVSILLDSPSDGGNIYLLGMAAGAGPTPIDSRTLKLTNDILLQFVIGPGLVNNNGVFFNFAGTLSAAGTTNLPGLIVPNVPSLVGTTLHVAFVTGGGFSLPSGINTISDSATITIM